MQFTPEVARTEAFLCPRAAKRTDFARIRNPDADSTILQSQFTNPNPLLMCGSRGAVSFGTPLGHPLRGLASLGYSRAHIPLRGIMPRRSLQIPSPIHVLQSILRVRSTASDAKSPTPLRRYEAGGPLSLNNHHSTTTQQNEMGARKVPHRQRVTGAVSKEQIRHSFQQEAPDALPV